MITTCFKCKDGLLLNNGVWDDLDLPQEVNTGFHEKTMDFVRRSLYNNCWGCNKITRRRIKILICLLYKLRLKI